MKVNDKLIRAGDLFEAVRNDTSIRGSAFAAIRRHIDAAPAVEAKEVVHGRWVHKGEWHIECPECRYILAHIGEAKKYCPNCGAMMDGDGNGK